MFVCAVVADRQPVIVYRFNGERIACNSSKHTLVTNSTHGTLTVFITQNSDEGTYSCSASKTMTELPPAMVTLSSALLYPADNNGSRLRISTSIYGRDSLLQQRQSFSRGNNPERQRIGSIILDVSLRQNGRIVNVSSSPSSNVVRPSFTKTRVSCLRRLIHLLESLVDQRLFFEPV